MFTHYTLSDTQVFEIAKTNAATNICLSEKMVDASKAHGLANVMAQVMELTVSSSAQYKKIYDEWLNSFYLRKNVNSLAPVCQELNGNMDRLTAGLTDFYNSTAADLNQSRAEEMIRISRTLSNMGKMNTYVYQPVFPQVVYKEQTPESQNFLVKTGSGITQCRIARTNFVFCL